MLLSLVSRLLKLLHWLAMFELMSLFRCIVDIIIRLHLYYNTDINYKTSIAPISLKRIELSGVPSTGLGKTHSQGTMQSSSTNIT